MTATHSGTDLALWFSPESFDHDIISTTHNLSNDNLFPLSKIRFEGHSAAKYETIEPALILASRMLLSLPQTFALFINRRPRTNDYVDDEDIIPHSSD
ncbi:hypothetical protein MMC14_009446 [Varicellaria rhodocarpa]|nr:hypothetical protein [Varicellaria rhodocarpa]